MMRRRYPLVSVLLVGFLLTGMGWVAGCGGGGGGGNGGGGGITLTGLSINGPASVNEGATATFTATATWSDNTTSSATATWSVTSGPGTIAASTGVLTAGAVTANGSAVIAASCTYEGVTRTASTTVTIVNLAQLQMGGSIQGSPLSLTGISSTLAGTAGITGSSDGTGPASSFNTPLGITTDGTNLFVADGDNHTIRKIVIATGVVTTLAGTAGVSGSADGTGTAATFNTPFGITTDGVNLFVTEGWNYAIRKIVIGTGVVTTIAGSAGVSGSADGTGSAAAFNQPLGITTDGTNLFVADTGNHTIRKIVIATGAVTTLAGTAGSYDHVDGTGAAALFASPTGITTDGTNLFVADWYSNTIRKVVIATGVVTTVAGDAWVSGSADGAGTTASFYTPEGITMDGANLYITDSTTCIIRQIVIATGVVTTVAGTAGLTGSADGTGAGARFFGPSGITTDGTRILIADKYNNTIRALQ